jgi:hypothetical protein
MKYPLPFLKYWYEAFSLTHQETIPTGTLIVVPSSVVVTPDMSREQNFGTCSVPCVGVHQDCCQSYRPRTVVVLKHWTLVSKDLITVGRNSGQYKPTFKCNIVDGDGKTCGTDRSILHCRDKTVSTTNLIRHVADMTHKCVSLSVMDAVLKNVGPNYFTVGGNQWRDPEGAYFHKVLHSPC